MSEEQVTAIINLLTNINKKLDAIQTNTNNIVPSDKTLDDVVSRLDILIKETIK